MRGRLWLGGLLLAGLALAGRAEAARIQVTASRTETLYAQTETVDCTALSKTADAELPFHIVRLTATPPPGVPPEQLRFQWKLPDPLFGSLAADQDLGPDEQASIIQALCAEVGNECALTAEQLAVYNHPSILWIAPTCDVLPKQTEKPYKGDRVKIGVKVFNGRRKVGKGSAKIGFGRIASATLFVADPGKDYRNGHGKPEGVNIFLNPTFAATFSSEVALPAIQGYQFDSGGGGTVLVTGCPTDASFAACTQPQQILYTEGGRHLAQVAALVQDGSAVCDNLRVNVRTVEIVPELEVTTMPAKQSFASGEQVGLRVRLHNRSEPATGANILLIGAGVLTCETKVKVGPSTLTAGTQIDLQHCSATVDQACTTNADCQPGTCADCMPGEICLTADHCTTQFNVPRGCATNSDCQPPSCPNCLPTDACVKVLPLPSILVGPGASVDIIESTIAVGNTLPTAAKVVDTWTVHTFNAGDDSDKVRYTIKGQR